MTRQVSHLLLALAVLLAGCASPPPDAGPLQDPASIRPTVVAMLDLGANPYHVSVAATSTRAESHAEAWGASLVNLSSNGTWEERRAADSQFWSSTTPGQLYAFSGTRLMAISMSDGQGPYVIDESLIEHGTATTSILAREDSTAIIVLVQVTDLVVCEPDVCVIPPSWTRAMDWIANRSWVDVVSISLALPGNPYLTPDAEPGTREFREATMRAASSGKLIVVGAGNVPTTTVQSPICGPPEIIAVGGAEPAHHAETAQGGKFVDVVSNYSEYVAQSRSTSDYYWTAGTSFATPIVAAALSHAIYQTRLAVDQSTGIVDGMLVNVPGVQRSSADFRNAMNATAVLWGPTDYSPLQPNSNDTITRITTIDLPTLAPSQLGWGYVDHNVSLEIVARILAADYEIAASKATVAAGQSQFQSARTTTWTEGGTRSAPARAVPMLAT